MEDQSNGNTHSHTHNLFKGFKMGQSDIIDRYRNKTKRIKQIRYWLDVTLKPH